MLPFSSVEFSSVTQSCPTLCEPMNCSTPGLLVHQLPEFTQTHPLSWWCHPTISSSVTHFSICPQYFPAPGSFPMSCLFTSNGQTIGASASTTVLPLNIQGWFPLGLTGLTSLQSKGLSRVFSSTTQFEGINSLALGLIFGLTLTLVQDYWKKPSFANILFICFYQPFIPLRAVPKLRV